MKNMYVQMAEQIQNLMASKLLFGQNYDPILLAKHCRLTISGVMYAQMYLRQPTSSYLHRCKINLPEKSRPDIKTLFLDLDETLIHCCLPGEQSQFTITYNNSVGQLIQEGIKVRPYLFESLIQLKKFYDIYIFSAGAECYCDAVVNQVLDPKKELISGILSRQYCLQTKNGYYIKDLRVIANRNLNEMVIVDNLSHSFGFQIENGIPIMSWYGDIRDQELFFLSEYLIWLQNKEIPAINKKKFQLEEFLALLSQISIAQ